MKIDKNQLLAAAVPGAWVENTHKPTHASLNSDPELAAAAVRYLLTGSAE